MDHRSTFYDTIAANFDSLMNTYEVQKRLRLVFEKLLPDTIAGLHALDAGCGTGLFTAELARRGACVTSLDIGFHLLTVTSKKHPDGNLVQGSLLTLCFADSSFDIIICTEVIEHTPDPGLAVAELMRVLKPGGILILTVPNKLWRFSVLIADLLHLRPYRGLENWVARRELEEWINRNGGTIQEVIGFNLFPLFFKPFHRMLDFADSCLLLSPFMVNIGIRARKVSVDA